MLYTGVFVFLYVQSTIAYLSMKLLPNLECGLINLLCSKNDQSSRAQFWMFLVSTTTFLVSTAFEATQITYIGVYFYSTFIKYQDIPLMERFQPVDNELGMGVKFVLMLTSDFLVSTLKEI